MKTNKKYVSIGLVISIVVITILCFINSYISNLSPTFITFLTFISGAIGFLIKATIEHNRETENRLFEKKGKIYGDILKLYNRSLPRVNESNKINNVATNIEITEASFDLLTWGSDNVVKQYVRYRNSSLYNSNDQLSSLLIMADFILAIRKDLGYENEKLNQIDVLSMFINFKSNEIEEICKKFNIEYKFK